MARVPLPSAGSGENRRVAIPPRSAVHSYNHNVRYYTRREAGMFDDQIIIQVLLSLIRHPGSSPAEVVRRLRGDSPPIRLAQVVEVFYPIRSAGHRQKRGRYELLSLLHHSAREAGWSP